MVRIRLLTAAYLFNNDHVLLLKRSKGRQLAADLWTGIGGHIEKDELNEPKMACLREIFEETGIHESKIKNLKLRYIILRKDKEEIRQHYIFWGNTSQWTTVDSDEGQLHWIPIADVTKLEMPLSVKYTFEHFLTEPNEQRIYIGTISGLEINWSQLLY